MALHFSQARDEHAAGAAGRVVDVLARLGFEHLRHLTPINVPEGMLIRLRPPPRRVFWSRGQLTDRAAPKSRSTVRTYHTDSSIKAGVIV